MSLPIPRWSRRGNFPVMCKVPDEEGIFPPAWSFPYFEVWLPLFKPSSPLERYRTHCKSTGHHSTHEFMMLSIPDHREHSGKASQDTMEAQNSTVMERSLFSCAISLNLESNSSHSALTTAVNILTHHEYQTSQRLTCSQIS